MPGREPSTPTPMTAWTRIAVHVFAGAAVFAVLPLDASRAQSLRGSRESVDRMYRHAVAEHLSFFETTRGVKRAVRQGLLVRLSSNDEFTLHKVAFPYVRPATRTFVQRLAREYSDECGEPLEVTSGVRPATRQPPNSVAESVHPTGIAVDLHKPSDPTCLRWLRGQLLDLEGDGVIEATEEFAPAHFHVAVFPTPYSRYVAAQTSAAQHTVRLASSSVASASTYRVRRGDTLWEIARAHETTVAAITSANHLDDEVIRPGQQLVIPSGQ